MASDAVHFVQFNNEVLPVLCCTVEIVIQSLVSDCRPFRSRCRAARKARWPSFDSTHSNAIAKNKTRRIRFSGHDDAWTIKQLD